ncbi:alpha-ketoglutarate-dependent dioxygenase AlkB [Sphingomonas crocodyli]|uniref:Alpha-ketoglutarate-dependent dioxygenase AlkB n=1 Tax=Sphingomonas crocodyli TaxID=1979270 RepID=A0A437LYH2_9SPHN|nr:alpha-ketoglutarate-dependent dioxygenase AlkB [Sphingomonas crocodyli]RVT90383.1 alpha-ketoglutarate-dependent dioxygenase AlkB [Sphingomonas crocodyli]
MNGRDLFENVGGADRLARAPGAPVPGLRTAKAIITPDEHDALIAAIDSCGLAPFRFQGWEGRRLTRSYGWHYDFDHGRLAPADPVPDWLSGVRTRMARLIERDPHELVQALLIRYDPGATIGWHRDRPQFGHVVGLSLGATATLRLRRRVGPGRAGFARSTVALEPRAAYALTGEIRRHWEHSIAALDETRWSVTFRTLASERCAENTGDPV